MESLLGKRNVFNKKMFEKKIIYFTFILYKCYILFLFFNNYRMVLNIGQNLLPFALFFVSFCLCGT